MLQKKRKEIERSQKWFKIGSLYAEQKEMETCRFGIFIANTLKNIRFPKTKKQF